MSPTSVFASGNTALITGAASGIGLAVAKLCRSNGMNLCLVDKNEQNLALAKESLASTEQITETYNLDVSQISQWHDLRDRVKKTFGDVDFLMLNAAVGDTGGWENVDYFRKIMDTNLFGVINGISTFLPVIQSQQKAKPSAIVITGSKQGITNPPGNMAYNASKFAVRALAEHLSYDLRGSQTSVHLLVPGWTFTGLSGNNPSASKKKEKPEGAWTAEQVAEHLEKRMAENKFWVMCPDNDVSEDTDKRRMLWTAGDAVYGRMPLSRWRQEYKEDARDFMESVKLE